MTTAALDAIGIRGPALADVPSATTRPTASAPPTAVLPVADADAIGEIWRTHGAALLRFAVKLTLGDRQRAEDIVQETLVRAWRHPEVVACGPAAIRPWLFTVTRHVAIDMWRGRSRAEEVIDDQPTDRADPTEHIEQAVTALDVSAALAQLTPGHRQVIVAMYYHGQSVAEIACVLGIPAGTVKSRAYYGLRQLRRALTAERPRLPDARAEAAHAIRRIATASGAQAASGLHLTSCPA